ncbi:3-oxoacyl-ACP reductase [Bogoriella caseilytica]|uniref:3-oxoacyl-[acyl-carrier protein] reductase n=1 Tax=Bogoriella caseilytica TaxID=56055 RepID=A0A3N2BBB9_9MICO|nr:3-oxoacyl-ACP reductase [Bogoriella caseilytica]ROR72550.1 3-oxoacyl-[acyl-carrier protein] reductase [Bogoriella caseilytica]
MSDKYLDLTRSGPLAVVAKKLGLPRPAKLRRTDPRSVDTPLVPGPVLVLADEGSTAEATTIAEGLLDWDLDVRRDSRLPEHERWGAVILVLTGLSHPAELSAPALELGSTLRQLASSARVITLSRSAPAPAPSPDGVAPALAAARHGVDGFVRTTAKEMRSGTTANGLVLAEGVEVTAPSVRGGLRFLLSARSAFVDGQLIAVGSSAGSEPQDWVRPLGGAVAVVTGAARGIGAEVAAVLARDGARVIGVDVPAAGEALAVTMNRVGGIALQLDITAADAAERILELARSRYGHLDIVVHNAGILRDKTLARMTADRFDALLAVNIAAPLRMNDTFAGELGGGTAPRIISLASTSGIAGNRGQSNYAASKAGVIGMTRALAAPMAQRGGTANAVAPGFIETEMTASIPPVPRQVARWSSSLQQGGQPVDVAETVAFLASPQAGGINGQTVRVCGQLMVGQ